MPSFGIPVPDAGESWDPCGPIPRPSATVHTSPVPDVPNLAPLVRGRGKQALDQRLVSMGWRKYGPHEHVGGTLSHSSAYVFPASPWRAPAGGVRTIFRNFAPYLTKGAMINTAVTNNMETKPRERMGASSMLNIFLKPPIPMPLQVLNVVNNGRGRNAKPASKPESP